MRRLLQILVMTALCMPLAASGTLVLVSDGQVAVRADATRMSLTFSSDDPAALADDVMAALDVALEAGAEAEAGAVFQTVETAALSRGVAVMSSWHMEATVTADASADAGALVHRMSDVSNGTLCRVETENVVLDEASAFSEAGSAALKDAWERARAYARTMNREVTGIVDVRETETVKERIGEGRWRYGVSLEATFSTGTVQGIGFADLSVMQNTIALPDGLGEAVVDSSLVSPMDDSLVSSVDGVPQLAAGVQTAGGPATDGQPASGDGAAQIPQDQPQEMSADGPA